MNLKEGFIICDNNYKNKLLKSKNDNFYNYIYLSQNQLIEKVYKQIDKKSILYLNKTFNLSFSLASEIINYLKWIEEKEYNNPKLDGLVTIHKALRKEGLIKYNELFTLKLKQFPITFIDPDQSNEYLLLKNKISEFNSDINEIPLKKNDYLPKVYSFTNINEEAVYVMNEIVDLLDKGVSLNDIYIAGATEEYYYVFKRLARHYNITMEFKAFKNVLSSKFCKDFIMLSNKCDSYQEILDNLDKNNPLYDKVFNIILDYDLTLENPKDNVDFFEYMFKKMSYDFKKYNQSIKFVNDSFLLNENSYLFYVGFDLGIVPFIATDRDYLLDKEKEILGLSTSIIKNRIIKNRLINFICQPNVTISYKSKEPSTIITELNLSVNKGNASYGYSKIEDELRLSSHYDTYFKYNEVHPDLRKYGLQKIDYLGFNHRYKPLSKELIQNHFSDKKLKLSYSSVKVYFACPFAYYVERILGLNEFKQTLALKLGNYSHAVLEESYNEDFDFHKSVLKNTTQFAEDGKDRHFFKEMKNVLKDIINYNRNHEAISSLKDINLETKIVINNEKYDFEGRIDKFMYTIINDDVYVAIVDYKTGGDEIKLDNIDDGFNLQLPSYIYLLNKSNLFEGKNIHIVGIYLQKIKIIIFKNNENIDTQKNNSFCLNGYTINDVKMISLLDPYYAHSDYIKSMKLTSKGFSSNTKLYDHKFEKNMVDLVKKLLDDASDKILSGDFKIAPKIISGKNESCKYCKYKDICFVDYKDYVELKKKSFKERD